MILAWQNNWDGATLAASSALGTLPVTNTQVVHLSQKWQTVAAVKTAFVTADMGTDETKWKQSLLAVLGSNLSKNAAFRLRGSASDANAVTDVAYDSRPLPATRGKALRMVRTSSNFASTPSAPANRLTGALDVRVRLIVDPALPDTECYLISRGAFPAGGLSWIFGFSAGGNLFLYLSTDGSNWANAGAAYVSTAAFANLFDGAPRWLRVTRSAAGQIIFYTSDDGQAWAQLGAAVAGTATALFDTADSVRLHGFDSSLTGYALYAEMRNGIGGPVVSKFDPDTDATVGGTSFTSSDTREVWSLNQAGAPVCAIINLDGGNLRDGDGRVVRSLSLAYLKVPGIAGNYAATPDTAANSITGDIDIRAKVMPNAAGSLISKNDDGTNQVSYRLDVLGDGKLLFYWSPDGTVASRKSAQSTLTAFAIFGVTKWVRVTLDVDNGAAGNSAIFYTSEDGITWTQLGATVTAAGVTSIFNGTAPLAIGATNGGGSLPIDGKVFFAEVRNALAAFGTIVVASFDPSRAAASGATSFTSETGEVWTINQAGSPKAELVRESFVKARYWRLDLTDYSAATSLQAGRVFLGPSWSISQALLYGWSVMEVDPSNVTKSRGGQSFPDAVAKYRMLDFTLDFLSEASIFDNAFAMARANGTVKDVLAIPLETGSYISEQAVWGRVISQEPLIHRLSQIFRQKFTVEERL